MNRRFLGSGLTNAQAILILVAANLIAMGYLTSLTNYNHDVATNTQKQIVSIINAQGNLTGKQREVLINEFTSLSKHGGLATAQGQQEALDNITVLLNQAQKIDNHTALVANQTQTILKEQNTLQSALANKIAVENQKLLKNVITNITKQSSSTRDIRKFNP